jgi:hypothetical protein
MELDEFVKTVLTQVLSGITKAQGDDKVGPFVVPNKDGFHAYPANARVASNNRLKSTIIDFDVAITVESSGQTKGGGGLKIVGIGANVEGQLSTKDINVSRIQFGVPLMLPPNKSKWVDV